MRDFNIGGYWLSQVGGYWYRTWYDAGRRQTRRRSLGETDLERAKDRLVEWYTRRHKPSAEDPASVYLSVILDAYLANVTDRKPSSKPARMAARLVLEHWGAFATVAEVTRNAQEDFMRESAAKGHSVAYISRNLSVLSAAIEHAELPMRPKVFYGHQHIADVLEAPMPGARDWIPALEDVGRLLDATKAEHLFRYQIVALNTAARPAAITDLSPFQIRGRLIDLNPPGRRQTRKYRPTVVATECLYGWLQVWTPKNGRYVAWGKTPIQSTKRAMKRLGQDNGLPEFNRYSLRHLVATEVRRRGVSKEEAAILLGHKIPEYRTTDRYEKFDPVYLANAVSAIDEMMAEIQGHAKRRLFAPENAVVAFKSRANGGKSRGGK